MSVPSPIVIPRLRLSSRKIISTQIYEFLRRHIIDTTIKPGTLLSENALSEHFHVSRQPVREAMMYLSYEGLLSVLPQRGSMVECISSSKLVQTVFVRAAIEKECVMNLPKLDGRSRRSCINQLERIVDKQRQCTAQSADFKHSNAVLAEALLAANSSSAFVNSQANVGMKKNAKAKSEQDEALTVADAGTQQSAIDEKSLEQYNEMRANYFNLDDSFHEHLCAISGADTAWKTIQFIKGQMDRIRFLTCDQITPIDQLTFEHESILKALKENDFATCCALLDEHLSTIKESHKAVITRYRDWFTPESIAMLNEGEDSANKV